MGVRPTGGRPGVSVVSCSADTRSRQFRTQFCDLLHQNIPEFDAKEITHFGLGVFFKAATHRWRVGKQFRQLDFGPYLEPIGQFLMGKAESPKNINLIFALFPPAEVPKTISLPYEWKKSSCHTYSFSVVGLEFVLSLGKQIPEWQSQISFHAPHRPVIVTDHTQQLMKSRFAQIIQRGGRKGKLKQKPKA